MAQVLAFSIQIDGIDKTIRSINELENAIKKTRKELKSKDTESPEFAALEAQLNNLTDAQRTFNNERKKAAEANKFAEGSYRALNRELVDLRNAFRDMSESEREGKLGKDTVTRIQVLDKELKRLDANIGNYQREVGNYAGQLKGKLDELRLAFANLTAEEKKSERGRELAANFREVNAELQRTNQSLDDYAANTNGYLKNIQSIGVGLLATFAAVGISSGLSEITTATADYSRSLSELQSLLGLSDNELATLEGAIGGLTTVTLEGGAVIVNTGKDIADALKLAGSARPDLLGNTEALAQFTKEAIIFSKAGSLPLQDGIDALSSTLNQFTLPATDAGRVMNTLAAAAKEGNAEIKDQTASFERFGAVADAANVSVEESAALVEILATKNIKGSEAGTALRNVLLRLQAPDALGKTAQAQLAKYGVSLDKIKDTSIPVGERLKELAKISGDATAMTEVFGVENEVAGQIILNSTKNLQGQANAFETLLPKITGTNEAYTAAGINANNLAQFIDNLKATAINLSVVIGGALFGAIQAISSALNTLVGFVQDNEAAFIAAGLSVAAYAAYVNSAKLAQLAYNATMALWTLTTNGAAAAQKALSIATAAVPYVAVGLLVFGLVKAIQAWTGASEENLAIQNAFNDAAQESAVAYAKEVVASDKLVAQVKDETLSRKERTAAFSELQKQYPAVLANYKNEADFLANIDKAQKEINASILDGIVLKLKQQQTDKAIQDNFKKVAELEAIRAKGGAVGIGGITFSKEQLDQANEALKAELGKQLEIVNSSAEQFRTVLAANSTRLIENERSKAVAISATGKEIEASQTVTGEKVAKESKKQETTLASLRKELEKLQSGYAKAAKKGTELIPVEVIDGIDKTKKAIEDLEKKLKALQPQSANDKLRAEATATQTINVTVNNKEALDKFKEYLAEKEKLNNESNDKQVTDDLNSQQAALNLKLANDKAAAEQEAAQRKEIFSLLSNEILSLAQKSSDDLFKLAADRNEREKENAISSITTQRDAELALAQGNTALQERINRQFAEQKLELDRKAFEENKKLQIAQALINGALAATAVFAVPDFTFGVASAIRLGFIAANTAAQVAFIEQQEFADGGVIELGKVAQGRRHNEGGIKFMAGGRMNEIEGGEFVTHTEDGSGLIIMNRKATQRYGAQLNQIGDSTFKGKDNLLSSWNSSTGGVSFAGGGVIANGLTQSSSGQTVTVTNTLELSPEQIAQIANEVRLGALQGTEQGAQSGIAKRELDIKREQFTKTKLDL